MAQPQSVARGLGQHTGMEPVLSLLGIGPSGRALGMQAGLVAASGGALLQALTITAACAKSEWGVGESRGAHLSTGVIVGQIVGAVLWAATADVVGRKEACCLSCVVGAGGAVVCAFAASFDVLVVASAVVGVAVAGTTLGPYVLAVERAPAASRGAFATTLALFAALGSAGAALAHALIAGGVDVVSAVGASDGATVGAQWRGVCAVVALAPFGAAVSCSKRLPESLRWLVQRRRFAAARRELDRAAAANFAGAAGRRRDVLAVFDAAARAPRPADAAPRAAACRVARSAASVASLCACGLEFLLAFGFFSVLSLVRLEFDADGRAAASAFYAAPRRLDAAEPCAAVDYGIVASALLSEVLGALAARHLVDRLGRRLTLAACFALAALGVLALAAPEYVASLDPLSRDALVVAMMTSRGALYGADAVATVFVAEMHGTESRFAALAVAYAAARLGGLVSASWVVSPNPLSTVSLLVTLVNVSAAWAALAMPSETALAPLDGAEPPPPKLPPPQAPPAPAPPVAAAVPAAAAANPFDDDVLRDAAPSPPLQTAVVDGEKTPLLT